MGTQSLEAFISVVAGNQAGDLSFSRSQSGVSSASMGSW